MTTTPEEASFSHHLCSVSQLRPPKWPENLAGLAFPSLHTADHAYSSVYIVLGLFLLANVRPIITTRELETNDTCRGCLVPASG
jgi:hypothetical protein